MTCHDARERLTDFLDDALGAEARADVTAHLRDCAECRAELERLRQTVTLLHGLEAPRAPSGFVGRVMAETHPRVGDPALPARPAEAPPRPHPLDVAPRRRFFFRLPVDLPAGAAAFLLLAVGVGFLVTRVPELQDASRVAPTTRSAPTPEAYAPSRASDRTAALSAPARPDGGRESVAAERDVPARTLRDRAPSAPTDTTTTAQAPAAATTPAPASGAPAPAVGSVPGEPSAPAPASAPRGSAASPPASAPAPAASPPPAALKGGADEARALAKIRASPPEAPARTARVEGGRSPEITAQLRVTDHVTAPATVINLVNHARGLVVNSSTDGDDRILEVSIPRGELPGLLEALRSVGALSADIPSDLPANVLLVLRIGA